MKIIKIIKIHIWQVLIKQKKMIQIKKLKKIKVKLTFKNKF